MTGHADRIRRVSDVRIKAASRSLAGSISKRFLFAAAIYAVIWQWRKRLLADATRRGVAVGPRWLALLACRALRFLSGLLGVRLASESGAGGMRFDQSRRYMLTWHPHGFVVYCPIFILAEKSIVGTPVGSPWHCTGAPAIFKLPIMGEILTLINGRPVDKKSLESILASGGTIAVQPGGIHEQAATCHDQEQAFFAKNLGFIRMAIRAGTPLLMMYAFGENQLFRRVDGMDWLTKIIHKTTGLTLPIWTGKWGIPQAPFPIKTNVHVRWGEPVEVGPAEEDPSEERVEEVFQRYLRELQKVFYENCHDCLPAEVAAKGLRIVRMDGKPVLPLDLELLRPADKSTALSTARSRM